MELVGFGDVGVLELVGSVMLCVGVSWVDSAVCDVTPT